MISIILYGRNDAHGYNLHRRAALSLNCLAEVLTDDDDEIVFVDYNTPDELPTFIEALADTLTDRCLTRIRVLRVPAGIHRERFQDLTHLAAVEPVCRNAAARRSSPANRWLLSTNTDMILLPHSAESLTDVCRGLADGVYGLPRFELPEWLWERLPRSDPRVAMSEVRRLGPHLHLDEPTLNHEWVRFDAPGDFQLCLREDYIAIDGCDERMLLGWHVDANLSRRLHLHRGAIESLEAGVAGYHCNHSRTPTVYHGPDRIANDLTRYFLDVEHADLPGQRDTWGLADTTLEEVAVRSSSARLTAALVAAIPAGTQDRSPSNPRDAPFSLTYDSAHVLSHVADSIAVSGRDVAIGYLGANVELRGLLERVVRELSRDGRIRLFCAADARELDELPEPIDLFVVDFGLDWTVAPQRLRRAGGHLPEFPASLRGVVVALDRFVQEERSRLERGMHPRRFVLVNSMVAYIDSFVLANFDCSGTSTHSRVRRATVRAAPTSTVRVIRDMRWMDRLAVPPPPLALRSGASAAFGDLEEFDGFGPGWWLPDPSGIWTHGPRATLTLTCGDVHAWTRPTLDLTFDRVGVRRGHPVRIGVVIDERSAGSRVVTGGTRLTRWRVRVPPDSLARGSFDVTFEIDGDGRWSDDNQLGLHLRSVGLTAGIVPLSFRERVEDAEALVTRVVHRLRRARARRPSRNSGRHPRRGGAPGP